jgi:hypothetical protein
MADYAFGSIRPAALIAEAIGPTSEEAVSSLFD